MFLAEILLVSRLLGLVAGEQRIEIQPDATVRSIEVWRDGQRIASLQQPPWRTLVNLGPELAPHDLTVIAFDGEGRELGRDMQAINVARPPAELGVLLERDAAGRLIAGIRWQHFAYRDPIHVLVKLDGRTISKTQKADRVSLGKITGSEMHVLSVNVVFPDLVKSQKEVVFGGGFSEQMPAELTPVAVRLRRNAPDGPANCFRTAAAPLPPAPVERGEGAAHFIINGRGLKRTVKMPAMQSDSLYSLQANDLMIVDPVAQEIDRTGGHTFIFNSKKLDGRAGTRRVVATAQTPAGTAQIADAVGAAALGAIRGGDRRVVVVVLGDSPARDYSMHSPAVIRRYLERIGVPLRVWSLTGPRPDLAATWGEARDVSTSAALLAATDDLRKELESQRVAWLPVAPLDAFRVVTSGDCAYAPLAGSGYALPTSNTSTPSGPAASAQ